jgi:hypothetical protein
LIIDNSHDLGMDHGMDQNFHRYLVDQRKGQLKKETLLSISKAPVKEKPPTSGGRHRRRLGAGSAASDRQRELSIWHDWFAGLGHYTGGLREDTALQFRAEFFNLFNHPQFSNPTVWDFSKQTPVNSPFGQITSLSVESRLIQLGLKYIF